MFWKGRDVERLSVAELTELVAAIASREEAQTFIAQYVLEHGTTARANIGYLAGYCDREVADRIYDWFEVVHPIFGRRRPSAEEAFAAGKALGERGRVVDEDGWFRDD